MMSESLEAECKRVPTSNSTKLDCINKCVKLASQAMVSGAHGFAVVFSARDRYNAFRNKLNSYLIRSLRISI